jgi:hypothetical protein
MILLLDPGPRIFFENVDPDLDPGARKLSNKTNNPGLQLFFTYLDTIRFMTPSTYSSY